MLGAARRRLQKETTLWRAKRLDVSMLRTVALVWGPQRNLTTLLGAILFLHPKCQVLNHAGVGIMGDPRLDFLKSFNRDRFDLFQQYSMLLAERPHRGQRGGSIVASHAVREHERMKSALGDTDNPQSKRNALSLVWKDSARMMNHLRTNQVDVGLLVERDSRLRFLMPVRNPLDCARSHVKTGGGPQFDEPTDSLEVLDSLLRDFAWFRDLQRQYPDRLFHFFEHDVDASLLSAMANFLEIESDPAWIERAMSAYELGSTYEHSDVEWDAYRRCVDKWFADDAEFRADLMKFVPKPDPAESSTIGT